MRFDRVCADFPAWLKREQSAAGLSNSKLARKIGVTQEVVSMWRRGVRNPSLPSMLGVLEVFGYSAEVKKFTHRAKNNVA